MWMDGVPAVLYLTSSERLLQERECSAAREKRS
jgi:hypothetical protein